MVWYEHLLCYMQILLLDGELPNRIDFKKEMLPTGGNTVDWLFCNSLKQCNKSINIMLHLELIRLIWYLHGQTVKNWTVEQQCSLKRDKAIALPFSTADSMPWNLTPCQLNLRLQKKKKETHFEQLYYASEEITSIQCHHNKRTKITKSLKRELTTQSLRDSTDNSYMLSVGLIKIKGSWKNKRRPCQ